MFEDLHAVLDQIQLPLSGGELAELLRVGDRLQALVVAGARSLDDDCAWQIDGAGTDREAGGELLGGPMRSKLRRAMTQ